MMKQDNTRLARLCRYKLCKDRCFIDITGRKYKSAYKVSYYADDDDLYADIDTLYSFWIYLEEILQEDANAKDR